MISILNHDNSSKIRPIVADDARTDEHILDIYMVVCCISEGNICMHIRCRTAHCVSWHRAAFVILCSDRHFYHRTLYSLFVNNILSVQTHNIRNYFLPAGKQNSWLFQKHCWNRAVAVSRSNFWSPSGSLQKDKEEKFYNSEKFAERKFAIFCFNCLSLMTFVLSNIHWKYSENCNILTKRTYDSAVFKIFLHFIIIEILYEILIAIMAFIAIYAIKVPVWKRCKTI